VTLEAVK